MIIESQFGPWLPDNPDFKNPGLEVCEGVIPTDPYDPAPQSEAADADAVPGTILGVYPYRVAGIPDTLLVVSTSGIYKYNGADEFAPSDPAPLTSIYTWLGGNEPGPSDTVAFAQFNANAFMSLTGGTPSRFYFDGTTVTVAPPTFPTSLSGVAMGRVGDFLVVGSANTLQWSAYNNPLEAWQTDLALQSGEVQMNPRFGRIQAVSGGDVGYIFQERAISRLVYVGSGSVFALERFEDQRGCVALDSVVRVGNLAYFFGTDGLFVTDGADVRPLSGGKVWEYVRGNTNEAEIRATRGALNWDARCVVWSLVLGGTRKQLWYSWEADRFSIVEDASEFICSVDPDVLKVVTLNASDILAGFVSGAPQTATGLPHAAKLRTGDMQPFPGRKTFVSEVTPIVRGTSDITVGARAFDSQALSPAVPPNVGIGPLGFAPVNASGRYVSLEFNISATQPWSQMWGYQAKIEDAGE